MSVQNKTFWDFFETSGSQGKESIVCSRLRDQNIYGCKLDTSFFDVNISLVGSRPLDQWFKTFQRHLWTYFCSWYSKWILIQLFRFASFILYFEVNVSHVTLSFCFGIFLLLFSFQLTSPRLTLTVLRKLVS